MAMIKCNRCGELYDEETGFYRTSRKYHDSNGMLIIYRYRHKICKKCRKNQNDNYIAGFPTQRKNPFRNINNTYGGKKLQQPFEEWKKEVLGA